MEVFYGFCRVVDDLVDEGDLEPGERRAGLDRYRAAGWSEVAISFMGRGGDLDAARQVVETIAATGT